MKKYSDLVYRDLKRNKRRGIYTILGVILGIILLTSIFNINSIFKENELNEVKKYNGDYEVLIDNLSSEEFVEFTSNVLVENYGRFYVEESGRIGENNYNIIAIDDFALKNMLNERLNLLEGRYPKGLDEIIIEENTATILRKSIGNVVRFKDIEYKIVGLYKDYRAGEYELNGVVSYNETKTADIILLLNLKNNEGIERKIRAFLGNRKYEKVNSAVINNYPELEGEERIKLNTELLRIKIEREGFLKGEISEEKIGMALLNLSIMLLTIVLIYSSINISLKEKVKNFSILRCLGASELKVKYLLFKESIIIGILSIIPGVLLGNVLAFTLSKIIYKGNDIYKNYIIIIAKDNLKVIMLSISIIFIGIIVPIMRSDKITPIEGIRSGKGAELKRRKRKNKLVRKLLGYNGELAYKNIRGNGGAFALTISIFSIVFVIFTGVTSYYLAIRSEHERILRENFNYEIRMYYPEEYEDIGAKERVDYLNEKRGELEGIIKEDNIVETIVGRIGGEIELEKGGYIGSDEIEVLVLNDHGFKHLEKNIGGEITLDEFKDNGVITVNGRELNGLFNYGYFKKYDIDKGEEFKINFYNNKSLKLNFLSDIDGMYVDNQKYLRNNEKTVLIISSDTYLNNNEALKNEDIFSFKEARLTFNIEDSSKVNDAKRFSALNKSYLIDNKSDIEGFRQSLFSIYILVNTILIIALIITTLNITNNKIIILSQRRLEIGTLMALGMKLRDLKKMIILEGVVEFIYASLVGGSLSLITMVTLSVILKLVGEVPLGYFNVGILLLGFLVIFAISILSSLVSLSALKEKKVFKLMRGE